MTFKITNETCYYEAQKIGMKPVDKNQVPTGMFCSVSPSSELVYELWIVGSLYGDPRSSAVSLKPAIEESAYNLPEDLATALLYLVVAETIQRWRPHCSFA